MATGTEEDDQLPFMESLRTCNWQLLGSLLKKVGPQRAGQLVTSCIDHSHRATALIVCARSPAPTHNYTPSHHHHHHHHHQPHSPTSSHHHNYHHQHSPTTSHHPHSPTSYSQLHSPTTSHPYHHPHSPTTSHPYHHHHHHHHPHPHSPNTLHPPLPDEFVKEDTGEGMDDVLEICQVLVNYGADLDQQDSRGRTALHWAVETHKESLAAMFVSLGADVRLADRQGFTPLHIAVRASSLACVQLLLQYDPQLLEERDGQGASPLTLAVQKGQSDLCRYLLQAGADVTAREVQTLRTPLHYALYLNHLHVFILLLGYRPNLRLADHRGTTVVHRSCAARDSRYLLHVLSSGCDHVTDVINMEDSEGATPIMVACQSNSLSNVQLLLESGANVSARDLHGRTALHHCVENTDTECVELLLKTDPSLLSSADLEGLTPLHMAVIAGSVPLIRLLLKRGASLQCRDQEDHTVAHWATVCGHSRVLDVLLEYGAELTLCDRHQAYPLHYAAQMMRQPGDDPHHPGENASQASDEDAQDPSPSPSAISLRDPRSSTSGSASSGHARLLKKLLACGVSAEVRDKDGRTPVIWAASAGNATACRILVEAGADVNSADNDGLSALHCAASRGHAECVRMLVGTCGARVDPVDRNQCTPLFYATTLGHDDCANILLDLGASSNHTDSRGRTTAHCAAVTGSRDSLAVLRKQGVDLWQPTAKGDYPIHEAAQAGQVEAVGYLLEVKEEESGDQTRSAIDTPNKDGRTCLHIAALTNDLWLAKFLLDHHADVNAVMRNKGRKYTPYDAAVAKGNKEAADYLQSREGRPASSKRPRSSKSKDRPASGKVDYRPSTSGQVKDRPTSGKSEEDRPASGKVKDRPSSSKSKDSGKVEDRPASGKVKDRPASGKVKDRPSSSKSKDRPSSGKAQESDTQHSDEEKKQREKSTSDADDQRVLAVVVSHSDRPRSSSPSRKKRRSPDKDSDYSSDEAGARPSTTKGSKAAADHADGRKVKSKAKKEESDSEEEDGGAVRVGKDKTDKDRSRDKDRSYKDRFSNKDKSPKRPSSSAKQRGQTDSESRSSSRQHTPKHANANVTFKTPESDRNGPTSVKKDDSERKTIRVSDTKEHSSSKNQNKKTTVNKPAATNRGRNAHYKNSTSATQHTRPSRQTHPKPQQKQTTRRTHRSHSSTSNSSRSRSSSLESRSSDMSGGGNRQKSKGRKDGGEGLNLFSDNENTDHEEEAIPARHRRAKDEASREGRSGPEEEAPDSRKRPGSGRLVATVQDSVRRYEQIRRSIQQLQQLRRTEIYSNHCRNVAMFHSLLKVYGTPNGGGAHSWDHILQDHHKQTRNMDHNRSKGGAKSSARGENKDNTVSGAKNGADENHVNGDKDSYDEKTTDRRQGSATSAKGSHSAGKENGESEGEEGGDGSPSRSPSPRRHKYYDYGDPMFYRQVQRQRAEDTHRLLVKAYRPALPNDLFLNGKAHDKPPTMSLRPRPSRPSTSKSLPVRPSPCQGRPTSTTSTVSRSSQAASHTNGLSKAQFLAVQKSYTIMTPCGTRSIRPRSAHPTMWCQSGRHTACTKPRIGSACSNCLTTAAHRDHAPSPGRGQQSRNGVSSATNRR